MRKRIISAALLICSILLALSLVACGKEKPVRIGVAMGVGKAARWPQEIAFMQARAEELGIEFDSRLNTDEAQKPLAEDCKELIDSGIDVLLLTPRDVYNVSEILTYAKEKKVLVLSYARCVMDTPVDLFVGYDTNQIGRVLGQYLTEKVYTGDYIVLKGDPADFNTYQIYDGSMQYVEPMAGTEINIILDDFVPKWSAETAQEMVMRAVSANGGAIDAILCPNDLLAGGAIEGLRQLGIDPRTVSIVGMDAELAAVQRLVSGEQDATVYLSLETLASAAIDQAVLMAKGEKPTINAAVDNDGSAPVDSYLVSGQLVTRENIDRVLIDTGHYTHEEVYGS